MKASVAVPAQAASITGSRDAPPVRWPQLSAGACQGTVLLGEWEGRALQTMEYWIRKPGLCLTNLSYLVHLASSAPAGTITLGALSQLVHR